MLGFFSLWPIEHYRSAAQVLAATKEQLCCSAATGCSSNLAVFIIHRVGKADTIAVIFYLMLPQKIRKKPAQKKSNVFVGIYQICRCYNSEFLNKKIYKKNVLLVFVN